MVDLSLKVGEKRKFSFDNKIYIIREVLDNPNIRMFWSYDSGICPHCKNKLTREIEYFFTKIEILGAEGKEDKDLTVNDIQLHGFTIDNHNLILSIDKYDEVFNKSSLFKKLIKKEIKEVK